MKTTAVIEARNQYPKSGKLFKRYELASGRLSTSYGRFEEDRGSEKLTHPSYCPDLAYSGFRPFCTLKEDLRGVLPLFRSRDLKGGTKLPGHELEKFVLLPVVFFVVVCNYHDRSFLFLFI